MSYQFKRKETVAEGLRRVARGQLDNALAEAADTSVPVAERVHAARKRGKKLRGLLRLVRPELGAVFKHENAVLRDAARQLAEARDAAVMLGTFERLAQTGTMQSRAEAIVRRALEARRDLAAGTPADLEPALARFVSDLQEVRERSQSWELDVDGFEAVAGGLEETYRRGRTALRHARRSRTIDDLHNWRKRVKYHLYHLRLLVPVWPTAIQARESETKRLSELLGEEHDLAVLRQTTNDLAELAGPGHLESLFTAVELRRDELQTQAFAAGTRLYAEKPSAFVKRVEHYWDAWQTE